MIDCTGFVSFVWPPQEVTSISHKRSDPQKITPLLLHTHPIEMLKKRKNHWMLASFYLTYWAGQCNESGQLMKAKVVLRSSKGQGTIPTWQTRFAALSCMISTEGWEAPCVWDPLSEWNQITMASWWHVHTEHGHGPCWLIYNEYIVALCFAMIKKKYFQQQARVGLHTLLVLLSSIMEYTVNYGACNAK